MLIGGVVGAIVETLEAGYLARLIVRILWCVILQVPWCLLGLAAARSADGTRDWQLALGSILSLGIVTAIGVPVSFLAVFLEQQTASARQLWEQQQLREAYRLVQRLCDVGSTLSLGDRVVTDGGFRRTIQIDPRRARQDLFQAVQYMQDRVDKLAAGPLTDANRLELVAGYGSLGELRQAEDLLRPLADRDAVAALKMAELQLQLKRSEQSRQWAEKALELAEAAPPQMMWNASSWRMSCWRAYDMLAVFAGEKADFDQAEEFLQEALQRLPAHAAHVHDRLAKHYEFIGELAKARQHQQQAAELAPNLYSPPEHLVKKMLCTGAPVGLARPKSSRYQ